MILKNWLLQPHCIPQNGKKVCHTELWNMKVDWRHKITWKKSVSVVHKKRKGKKAILKTQETPHVYLLQQMQQEVSCMCGNWKKLAHNTIVRRYDGTATYISTYWVLWMEVGPLRMTRTVCVFFEILQSHLLRSVKTFSFLNSMNAKKQLYLLLQV